MSPAGFRTKKGKKNTRMRLSFRSKSNFDIPFRFPLLLRYWPGTEQNRHIQTSRPFFGQRASLLIQKLNWKQRSNRKQVPRSVDNVKLLLQIWVNEDGTDQWHLHTKTMHRVRSKWALRTGPYRRKERIFECMVGMGEGFIDDKSFEIIIHFGSLLANPLANWISHGHFWW